MHHFSWFAMLIVLSLLALLADRVEAMHRNVLGNNLEMCSESPLTGFHRTGFCETDENDHGLHLVCATVTQAFLDFTRSRGNDLSTPSRYFPGLRPGDNWCLCVLRWYEAYSHGHAPPVNLAATHERTLDHLRRFNLGLNNLSHTSDEQPPAGAATGGSRHQNGFHRPHNLDDSL